MSLGLFIWYSDFMSIIYFIQWRDIIRIYMMGIYMVYNILMLAIYFQRIIEMFDIGYILFSINNLQYNIYIYFDI